MLTITAGEGYVNIGDEDVPSGSFRVKYDGNNVTILDGSSYREIVSERPVTEIVNGATSTPFASLADFKTFARDFFFDLDSGGGEIDPGVLEGKADLDPETGQVEESQLPLVVYGDDFSGEASVQYPLRVKDPLLKALQFLGSPLKGYTVGINPYLSSASNHTFATGNYYGGLIEIPEKTTLTGVQWMLAVAGVGITSTNENRIGLFKYNQGGVLTQVAATANNATLYTQTAGNVLQEPFSAPYNAEPGFYFLVFIYSSSAQTTAPAIAAGTFGLANKVSLLTTNSAKIIFKSLSAGKTALPSTITFSTDTNTVNMGFTAGVY